MKNIKISVIVPIHNVESYLEKCLSSICEQTYTNLEIILVDDGSTDGSGSICDQFTDKDNRIKVIHKTNGGATSARKAGCLAATGEYIINVDGDDWIGKERFEHMVIKGLYSDVDMVFMAGLHTEYEKITYLPEKMNLNEIYEGNEIIEKFLFGVLTENHAKGMDTGFALWQWGIRRDLYVKHQLDLDDKVPLRHDFFVFLPCLFASKKIACINEGSYHYLKNRSSSHGDRSSLYKDYIKVFSAQLDKIIKDHNLKFTAYNTFLAANTFRNLIFTNYLPIIKGNFEYLFPFEQVKKGSKIIIYGAGVVGTALMQALTDSHEYKVINWVDKNKRYNERCQRSVSPVEAILSDEYDYIVIAIKLSIIAESVKNELISMGVPHQKIALMNGSLLNYENLKKVSNFSSPDLI